MDNKQRPTILLIEMDDEVRPLLKQNLQHAGYGVIVALNEEDAIERMRDRGRLPDLILLNQVGQTTAAFSEIGRRVRQSVDFVIDQAAIDNVPIVVIADRYEEALEGHDIEVRSNQYVTYPADAEQLINLLDRLCKS